jgi:HD-GYP domain-containing protein (c-di-GMP phosphodiesterase class II)
LLLPEEQITALSAAIAAKDPFTLDHCERVARYAAAIGERFDLSAAERSVLYQAAFLHDVGKIGIRDDVLLKEGPLTEAEFLHIQGHPRLGASILSELPEAEALLPTVLYHHERWDGRGYPEGLFAEATPLLARIVSVADSFDAMISHRCYRPALPFARSIEILKECSGSQWDPLVVRTFLEVIQDSPELVVHPDGDPIQLICD